MIYAYRPASSEAEDIIKLFDAGMSCARLNLSHGTVKVGGLTFNHKFCIVECKDLAQVSRGLEVTSTQALRINARGERT